MDNQHDNSAEGEGMRKRKPLLQGSTTATSDEPQSTKFDGPPLLEVTVVMPPGRFVVASNMIDSDDDDVVLGDPTSMEDHADNEVQQSTIQFSVHEGECVWLRGGSGAGKTSIARVIAGLERTTPFGAKVAVTWRQGLKASKCVAIVSQDAELINSLTVGENISMAMSQSDNRLSTQHPDGIKHRNSVGSYLADVGLDAHVSDLYPSQLSGGMRRRAAIAQMLAMNRRLLILDEPFVGCDETNAQLIAQAVRGAAQYGCGVMVISHQSRHVHSMQLHMTVVDVPKPFGPHRSQPLTHTSRWSRMLLTLIAPCVAVWIALAAALNRVSSLSVFRSFKSASRKLIPRFGIIYRTLGHFVDHFFYSLPVVAIAGVLVGASVMMVVVEVMRRIDGEKLMDLAPQSLKSSFSFSLIRGMAVSKADGVLPVVKRKIVSCVFAYIVVVEVSPLLTALLMAGRIGGSHAGAVCTMRTTGEYDVLRVMGVSTQWWSLVPSVVSCVIAGPLLAAVCALAAIATATSVAAALPEYAATENGMTLWQEALESSWEHNFRGGMFYDRGLSTWPPFIMWYRSVGFHVIIVVVSEVMGQRVGLHQHRLVPHVITLAVVCAAVCCIAMDWLYSRLLVNVLIPALL
eukprot:c12877_g1_i1.p1 GENE.c12877_g1_i1~~c12877_g1_i1.p1  ORF type:complete len:642 (+),score=175.59 c12877_g1_i1:40-1926(+)